MAADEAGTLAKLKALRAEVFDPITAKLGGRIFKNTGDGALAEFSSAVDAVQSAMEVQQALAALAEDDGIVVRIGISLGDVIVDGDDLFGNAVNVAARMEALAEPGGICVSGNVQEHIGTALDVDFEDLGAQLVKNIDQPIHSYRVLMDGQAPSPPSERQRTVTDKPSIAVLPFENMSGDPEQEYFADGMTEEIITALSRIDSIFVIARNSSFTFKGRSVDVRDVARELGVRYVLEGSVRRGGGKVRITGQLIDAENGAHLWADRFDGDLENIFDLQDSIAESVVGVVEPTLREAEIARSQRKGPKNLDAYDFLLRSMPNLFAFKKDENTVAISLLEKAIDLDPELAPALALQAWCLQQRASFGWQKQTHEGRAVVADIARRAIAVGQNQASALATAGFVLVVSAREFSAGLAAARRALELNVNSAYVCMHAGFCHAFDGAAEEAIQWFERSKLLSPLDPLTFHIHGGMAIAHLIARRPQEAYDYATKSQAENSDWIIGQRYLISACGHLRKMDEGRTAIARMQEMFPGADLALAASWSPYRDLEVREYFLDGLRKAGLS